MKLKITGLLLMIFLMTSCSCLRAITGMILGSETQHAIPSAKISVVNQVFQRLFDSDSLGYFNAYISGGPGCPRIKATVEAHGYQTATFREPKNRDTLTI